jgi:hypothetical protein
MASWRLRCGGRGSRKAQNKQADRQPRQHDIIKHDAAISAPVIKTMDGRITCSVAMISATMPNTEFLNSEVASTRVLQVTVFSPASQASATGENSITR